jgi:hypothetical protein
VLKPLQPLEGLAENDRVTLTLEEAPRPLITDVVGIMPDEDAREMMRIIDSEFGSVDPDDWK